MEILMAICLIAGTFFTFMAALGILKMPDIYMRTHAATKAGTFGIGMIVLAVALFFKDMAVTSRVIGIMLFFIMTTPAAAHLLGKIIMNSPYRMWRNPFQKNNR
ncbi:MAG: monovalent cation/H(+) antiporter subunit G [Desulfobacter sp.]|jgi:multicomponent Na+:H+ antiporter subunit G|uniref:monovalent cation/H(+) antiporter subunit G n=1 Tax=uncultured Desulfobacter sp. TaxID=240139 RepID=UPI0029C9254C|nr:monovalent cation/H(+) antiporter subunit G [uncultured Desulfobacter sp.]MCW8799591.1 monovalent cation/H(+) antiporter subunit G [Desulfobacter sp.]